VSEILTEKKKAGNFLIIRVSISKSVIGEGFGK